MKNNSKVLTGISSLDELLGGGFTKGELVLLASRPGIGKSSLAINLAINAALEEKSCALFSLEMPKEQYIQRILCSLAGVSIEKAIKGELEDKEWKKLNDATKRLENAKLFIDDSKKLSAEVIFNECKKLKQEHGLDFVVIDYLQLVSSNKDVKDRNEIITNNVREFQKMAKELDVVVMVLTQTPRDCQPGFTELNNENEPTIQELEKMGVNKKDCDVILFLYDKNTKDDDVELIVVKNGNERTIDLKFDKECLKFKD